jgi:hypothetical protein
MNVAALLVIFTLIQSGNSAPHHQVKLRRTVSRYRSSSQDAGARSSGLFETGSSSSFYVASLFIGSPRPQLFDVVFDTASGQVVLPSSRCNSLVCREHNRFAPRASSSAQEINHDGRPLTSLRGYPTVQRDAVTIGVTNLEFGSGNVTGDLVREGKVCFGVSLRSSFCTSAIGIVAATEMTDIPFRLLPYDGVVGLGFPELAPGPLFHVMNSMPASVPRIVGLFLGAEHGELALGGFDEQRLDVQTLRWLSVTRPEEGYWQFTIRRIRIGNKSLACTPRAQVLKGGCRGIIDSTASAALGVPPSFQAIVQDTCIREPLFIDIGDGTITLTLNHEETFGNSSICSTRMLPTDLPEDFSDVFLLGQPFLLSYYTIFDFSKRQIGFAVPKPNGMPSDTGSLTDEPEMTQEATIVLSTPEAEAFEAFVMDREKYEDAEATWKSRQVKGLWEYFIVGVLVQVFLTISFRSIGFWTDSSGLRLLLVRLTSAASSQGRFKVPGSMALASKLLAATTLEPELLPEASECVVCLGVCEEERPCINGIRPRWCRLRCGHCFHEDCILEWLWKAQRCPVCRHHVLDDTVTRQKSVSRQSSSDAVESQA